ncbi:MAG: hypothetical protein E6G92_07170 [Alphaproteobacteria bacterium]|nr:MAG: hypothetical protein E6G92_07170 [Alphaproteobacteria bacterium]
MGKVLKVVAVVVAVAVIVFAPYLLPGALAAIGVGSLFASAIVAATVVGAGMALHALTAPKPRAANGTAPLATYPQGTAVVRSGPMSFGAPLPPAPGKSMPPKRDHWLRHFDLWDVRRFHVIRLVGGCMAPLTSGYSFAIVDVGRDTEIREGDLFTFDVRDREKAWPRAVYGRITGVVKRFRGINAEAGFLECECYQPAHVIHSGLSNLRHAHRIRALAPTLAEAYALLREVRANPDAFDERLAA